MKKHTPVAFFATIRMARAVEVDEPLALQQARVKREHRMVEREYRRGVLIEPRASETRRRTRLRPWPVSEIAAEFGVSEPTVSHWQSGRVRLPDAVFSRLCEIAGMSDEVRRWWLVRLAFGYAGPETVDDWRAVAEAVEPGDVSRSRADHGGMPLRGVVGSMLD